MCTPTPFLRTIRSPPIASFFEIRYIWRNYYVSTRNWKTKAPLKKEQEGGSKSVYYRHLRAFHFSEASVHTTASTCFLEGENSFSISLKQYFQPRVSTFSTVSSTKGAEVSGAANKRSRGLENVPAKRLQKYGGSFKKNRF